MHNELSLSSENNMEAKENIKLLMDSYNKDI